MKISDVMNKVATIEEDVSIKEVAKVLSKEGIGSLVYVKEGKAAGIITEGDIIRNIARSRKKKILSQVMTKKLVTIGYACELEEAAELMKKKKVKRLLVVDESGSLVGIVTSTDIISNADVLNKIFPFFD